MNLRVDELYAYMREREAIRLRRANGDARPWTDDPILDTWKFTNVHREHDRTSRLLIKEFYCCYRIQARSPTREDILWNAAVFRYFGTIEFARAVGWTNPRRRDVLHHIESTARRMLDAGKRVYTGAYIVTSGNRTGPKEQTICRVYLADLRNNLGDVASDDQRSWQIANERLRAFEGFGPFVAKEAILDARYAGYWDGDPVDVNVWCPMGPGARRGASRLADQGRLNSDGRFEADVNEDQALEICKRAWKQSTRLWPREYGTLELHDIQWNLCEWDKYERVRLGQGTPRSRFQPTEG